MKKIFTLFLMLLIINNAKSQTKEETERWILYQMSENFYVSDQRILNMGVVNYSSFQYKIVDEYFIIIKSVEKEGTPTKKTFSVINLKGIIDVTLGCNIEPDIFDRTKNYAEVTFTFKDENNRSIYENFEYSGDSSLTKENIEKSLKEKYYGFGFYSGMYFGIAPSIKTLCPKIKKAFLHLAELNGAKVIKDIFDN